MIVLASSSTKMLHIKSFKCFKLQSSGNIVQITLDIDVKLLEDLKTSFK